METTGLLTDVKRFAVHDGPGVRTTFFLKGCSLRCVWCHNPEGISAKPQLAFYAHRCVSCGECERVCPSGAHTESSGGHVYERQACRACGQCEAVCLGEALKQYGRAVSVDEAVRLALEDRDYYADTGGVTLSGGEPMRQAAFVEAALSALRRHGIHTAVDTCGCAPWEAYERILPLADMFLYDIKHIEPQRHRELTGQGNEAILRNLRALSEAGARVEVRIPLVPGCNDDIRTLEGIGTFLRTLRLERVKVLPYHALARSKYRALGLHDTMPQVESPTDERVREVAALLRAHGVPAVSGQD